jgi:hypothetical protein
MHEPLLYVPLYAPVIYYGILKGSKTNEEKGELSRLIRYYKIKCQVAYDL